MLISQRKGICGSDHANLGQEMSSVIVHNAVARGVLCKYEDLKDAHDAGAVTRLLTKGILLLSTASYSHSFIHLVGINRMVFGKRFIPKSRLS